MARIFAISKDGESCLCAIEPQREVALLSAKSGNRLRVFKGSDWARGAFFADGDKVVVAGGEIDGKLRVWEASSGALKHTITGPDHYVGSLKANRVGSHLVTSTLIHAADLCKIALWNVAGRKVIWSVPVAAFGMNDFAPSAESISDDGKLLAISGGHRSRLIGSGPDGGRLLMLDATDRSVIFDIDLGAALETLSFVDGGSRLLGLDSNGGLLLFDTKTGDKLRQIPANHEAGHDLLYWMSVSGDQATAIASIGPFLAGLYSTRDLTPRQQLRVCEGNAILGYDGKTALSIGTNGTAWFWKLP